MILHPTYLAPISHFALYINNIQNIKFEWHDTYQKQTLRNRTYIYGANGKQLLSIPVKHHKKNHNILYRDLQIENNTNWQAQHWKSIISAYSRSPFFEYFEDELNVLYKKPYQKLIDFNIKSIEIINNILGIETNIKTTNEFRKNYDATDIDARELVNQKKTKPLQLTPYIQVFENKHGFISNLSILDLICNEGTNASYYLKQIPNKNILETIL